jgi:hypothetical protein
MSDGAAAQGSNFWLLDVVRRETSRTRSMSGALLYKIFRGVLLLSDYAQRSVGLLAETSADHGCSEPSIRCLICNCYALAGPPHRVINRAQHRLS